MAELKPVLPAEEIDRLVSGLARQISSDYSGRDLVLVAALKGAFIFLSDLARKLAIPVAIDFVQAASYGSGSASSGRIRLTKELGIDIRDRDVLLVEDIIDTGLTIDFLLDYLRSFHPRSLAVCALIDKRERRQRQIQPAYVGRVVAAGFLVGYGLDYAEAYRNLPGIYDLNR
ncbi:MAG: hypoxanthine phosphoribosyltransferase [Desulfobacterales bacterium]|jgi:hypoxanthine phosphoribosyltransferase|nr:hypoxanthine phosphoribosyltransferase [Desulfobacterales bacterium]